MRKRSIAILILTPLTAMVYGQASLTNAGYTQNFDSLTALGDSDLNNIAGHWTDNSTLAGWYKTAATYTFDSGANTDAIFLTSQQAGQKAIYSVGQQFSNERSLGIFNPFRTAQGADRIMEEGLQLRNNTGSKVVGLDVTFTEEHWRKTAQINRPVMHTAFSYKVGGTGLADSGYTAFADLDIVSLPQGGTVNLDGNLAANQRLVHATITGFDLDPGQDIWLKWTQWNFLFNGSSDSSFNAMDNLSIQAVTAPVPEPASMTALGLGALALIRRRRSRSAK